jgi:hypothetical protein
MASADSEKKTDFNFIKTNQNDSSLAVTKTERLAIYP